ncbi:MAG: hypothetical protein AAB776_00090 [Patescibacteria group bacterium]
MEINANNRQDPDSDDEATTFLPHDRVRVRKEYLTVCLRINGKDVLPVLSGVLTGDAIMTVIGTTLQTAAMRLTAIVDSIGERSETAWQYMMDDDLLDIDPSTLELVEVMIRTATGTKTVLLNADMLELVQE